MTVTITDLFCGAGGSSLGAQHAGATVAMAANHWPKAIDVHQHNFPDARHDCADISQVDPRRYPSTNVLLASPECTNHTAAKGVSRRRQDPTLFDSPDLGAERSRATMWDVHRFVEHHNYDAVIVENVVEATRWVYWSSWWQAWTDAGYDARVVSLNSAHTGEVAQWRDRIYVVAVRRGLPTVDLDVRPPVVLPCHLVGDARGRRRGPHGRGDHSAGERQLVGAIGPRASDGAAGVADRDAGRTVLVGREVAGDAARDEGAVDEREVWCVCHADSMHPSPPLRNPYAITTLERRITPHP